MWCVTLPFGAPMSEYADLSLAREIIHLMIGRYGQHGYDRNNSILMQLLADEKALKRNDPATIEKIIRVYGPMVASQRKDN